MQFENQITLMQYHGLMMSKILEDIYHHSMMNDIYQYIAQLYSEYAITLQGFIWAYRKAILELRTINLLTVVGHMNTDLL